MINVLAYCDNIVKDSRVGVQNDSIGGRVFASHVTDPGLIPNIPYDTLNLPGVILCTELRVTPIHHVECLPTKSPELAMARLPLSGNRCPVCSDI